MVVIRPAQPGDAPFLAEMLAEAVNWDPARPPIPDAELRARPELAHYVDGWPRPTDAGVVAEEGGDALGAAWYRFFTAGDPGYGFVDATIPEVTIGVVSGRRGAGIGAALLRALGEAAAARSIGALSLSVEHANPARRLYEREGFVVVGDDGDAFTMRLDLGSEP